MSLKISNKPSITLVCFAVKEEAAPFKRLVHKDASIRVLVTGMGKRNSEKAVRTFLEHQTPALVLTCGFAGGLDPTLKLGDVLYEADYETGLIDRLARLKAKQSRFLCASHIVVTSGEKRALRSTTGNDAVEMESGCIRMLCHERNIPSATIRVISDTAEEDLPLDFNAFMTPDDNISYARLGLAVLKSPGKIAQLLALQKRTALAAENLAQVLAGLTKRF